MKKTPFFSIIIPVSKSGNRRLLKKCLRQLSRQDYKQFEIILVEEARTNLSKSQARNYGANKAMGKYLVHIDLDYLLHPTILKKCFDLINQKGLKTIILRENVSTPQNIWQEARNLEKEILSQSQFLSTPQIIEKSLFIEIEGFDEEIDELDDWILNIKLNRRGVKTHEITSPITYVYESTNIAEIFKRRFNKGRYLKPFRKKYGDAPQINVFPTLKLYWKRLTKPLPPSTLTALVILKFFDLTAFYLGSLFPPRHPQRAPRPYIYQKKETAELFDSEQNSLYARFKHKVEVKSLLSFLPPIINHPPASHTRRHLGRGQSPTTILELGCGTGRISKVLVDKGFRVTPTDVSPAMLEVYKKKMKKYKLPKPTLLKPGKLPYKNSSYDYVVALRVIWHIEDEAERELFLKEAVRVAKKSVIMDFAIKGKGLNRLFKKDYFSSQDEVKKVAARFGANLETALPLPLGRVLLKFKKL